MAVNFPIDKSYLVASWCAASLWGAFTVIFVLCVMSTFTRPGRSRNFLLLGMVIAMYLLASVHVSMTLARNINAFIVHINDVGPIMYLADIGQHLNRSKDMIYITLIWLGDTVLLWRCFMVWNKNYLVVALPTIMVIGTAISGYGAVGQYFLTNPNESVGVAWAQGMLVISMVTNIILTTLTAGRVWMLSRAFRGLSFDPSRARYNYVILLIIESGVIVTVSKIIELLLFELSPLDGLAGNNALYIVMDCMPQIMGICPTFIILAVNRGFVSADSETYTSSGYAQGRNSRGREARFPIILARQNQSNSTEVTAGKEGHYHV